MSDTTPDEQKPDALRLVFDKLRIDMHGELANDPFYADKAAKLLDEYEAEVRKLIAKETAKAVERALDSVKPVSEWYDELRSIEDCKLIAYGYNQAVAALQKARQEAGGAK